MSRRAFRSLLGALALVLAACSAEEDAVEAQAPPVAVARVVAVDLEESLAASGELVARNLTSVAAEVSGRVSALHIDEGEAAAQGDAVLSIDPERRSLELEAARARVERAKASLDNERRELERMRTLRESNVASQSRLEEAQTAHRLAKANLAAERAQLGVAERALADASVTAPFAGLVARRHVNIGAFVQPGTPLFDLVSLDPIDVVFHLAEVDSGRVHLGQHVEVTVAPYPDRSFRATVSVVSPTIDPESRTLRVKATLPNGEGLLRPGLFARADLGVATRRGVKLVPEEAVIQRADGAVAFTVGDDLRVRRRVVKIGEFREGAVEILSGLEVGERVITRGQSGLVDGALVRIPTPPTESGAAEPIATAEPPREAL